MKTNYSISEKSLKEGFLSHEYDEHNNEFIVKLWHKYGYLGTEIIQFLSGNGLEYNSDLLYDLFIASDWEHTPINSLS